MRVLSSKMNFTLVWYYSVNTRFNTVKHTLIIIFNRVSKWGAIVSVCCDVMDLVLMYLWSLWFVAYEVPFWQVDSISNIGILLSISLELKFHFLFLKGIRHMFFQTKGSFLKKLWCQIVGVVKHQDFDIKQGDKGKFIPWGDKKADISCVGPSSEQCCFGLRSSVYFQLPVLNSFALARTVFGSFTKTITAIDLMARGIEFWFNTIKTDFLIAELEKIPVSSALLFQSVEK